MLTPLRRGAAWFGSHLRQNLVAYLALVIALGTTGAYAAEKVRADDIAKSAVRAKHIKKQAVKTKHLKNGSVTARKLAPGVAIGGVPGAPGAEGPEGPQGPPGPSTGAAGGDLQGSYPNPTLSLKPGASASLFSSVELLSGAVLSVPFTTEGLGWDVGGVHDHVVSPHLFTVPRAGKYAVSVAVSFQTSSLGTFRRAWLLKNKPDCSGTIHYWAYEGRPPQSVGATNLTLDNVINLGAGDTLRVCALHDAGVPLDILGTSNGTQVTRMAVQWVAP